MLITLQVYFIYIIDLLNFKTFRKHFIFLVVKFKNIVIQDIIKSFLKSSSMSEIKNVLLLRSQFKILTPCKLIFYKEFLFSFVLNVFVYKFIGVKRVLSLNISITY